MTPEDMSVESILVEGARTIADSYEQTDFGPLCTQISDDFMGETGDLIREHAALVIAVRLLLAKLDGGAPS